MPTFASRDEERRDKGRTDALARLRGDDGGQLHPVSIGTEGQDPDRDPVPFCDQGVGIQDIHH